MKKFLMLACTIGITAVSFGVAACDKTKAEIDSITEWNILEKYDVNVNAKNNVPTVIATTKSGKKIAASAEIYDDNGEMLQIIDGTFFVNSPVGKTYCAVYYVLQGDRREERETTFVTGDALAPSFITEQTKIFLNAGGYLNIDDYFTLKDNTSVKEVNYACEFNGTALDYAPEIGLIAEEGTYKFKITAKDGYGNQSVQNFTVTASNLLYEFDDAEKTAAVVAHVTGAKSSYPWYFHYANVFSYKEKAKLGNVAEGLREGAKGVLYYDFSYKNHFCTNNNEAFDYRDYAGVMIPVSSIPDYLTSIKVRVYLVKNDGEGSSDDNYFISPTEQQYSFQTHLPVNCWTEVEIPAKAIYETRYDFGDTTSFYSIGYFMKSTIDAFYIDDIEIAECTFDESAVHIGKTEYPDGGVDLTDFVVLQDTIFEYEVQKDGEIIPMTGNAFIPVGAGAYTVIATAVEGKYAGYTRTETINIGGYALKISPDKAKYSRGEMIVIHCEITHDGAPVRKNLEIKTYYDGELVAEKAVFKAEKNGYYRVVAKMEENGKTYKAESNVFVGQYAVDYNAYKDYQGNIERYAGKLDWNGGYRSEIKTNETVETREKLPEEMLSALGNSGGALHIIRDGYLRYSDGTAPDYYAWEWHKPDETVFAQGNTLVLRSALLNGNTNYGVLMVKAFIKSKSGEPIKWTIYNQEDYTNGKQVKYLEEGWNTLYITAENVKKMLGTGWDRLPLGHFDGVKDMWISYIAVLSEKEQAYSLNVVNAISGKTEKVSFRYGMKSAPIQEAGYTFVGYTLTKNGNDFVETDSVKDGETVYANFFNGLILNDFNEEQSIGLDSFNFNYNWNAGERVLTNTNVMFRRKSNIPSAIAIGMYRGSKGMLHVIQNGNVGDQSDESHAEGRSIWFRAGFVSLPEEYTSVSIRVYIETDEGKTARHFMFENENGWNTDKYSNRYITREDMTSGWYTITIPKSWIEKQNIGVESYFGIGHFDNVKNLYIDYVAYNNGAEIAENGENDFFDFASNDVL